MYLLGAVLVVLCSLLASVTGNYYGLDASPSYSVWHLQEIDENTGQVTVLYTWTGLSGAMHIAAGVKQQTIYAASGGPGDTSLQVAFFDLSSKEITQTVKLPTAGDPGAICYSELTQTIYVANFGCDWYSISSQGVSKHLTNTYCGDGVLGNCIVDDVNGVLMFLSFECNGCPVAFNGVNVKTGASVTWPAPISGYYSTWFARDYIRNYTYMSTVSNPTTQIANITLHGSQNPIISNITTVDNFAGGVFNANKNTFVGLNSNAQEGNQLLALDLKTLNVSTLPISAKVQAVEAWC